MTRNIEAGGSLLSDWEVGLERALVVNKVLLGATEGGSI